MFWTPALILFIAQILCCNYVRNKFLKYLPTVIPAVLVLVPVFSGGWSVASVLWMAMFGSVLLAGVFAIVLYWLVR